MAFDVRSNTFNSLLLLQKHVCCRRLKTEQMEFLSFNITLSILSPPVGGLNDEKSHIKTSKKEDMSLRAKFRKRDMKVIGEALKIAGNSCRKRIKTGSS